jgi:hypothetical protein
MIGVSFIGKNGSSAVVLKLTRIEHGSAAEPFPQDTNIAARDCHQHERRYGQEAGTSSRFP